MRYRILAILAALMTVIGLSASAAAAAPRLSPVNGKYVKQIRPLLGPYHLTTNDNPSVGITYPSPGNQATITTNPGNSHITRLGGGFVTIHNDNGNCLRMRNASSSYAVMEEKGCNRRDNNEVYIWLVNGDLNAFENVATHQFLGVSCPAKNGNKMWGVTGDPGTCFNWLIN